LLPAVDHLGFAVRAKIMKAARLDADDVAVSVQISNILFVVGKGARQLFGVPRRNSDRRDNAMPSAAA